MLKWLLRKRIDAFERTNNYDMAYARAMLEANPHALIRFSRAVELGQYRGPLPEPVWYAVKLVAAEHEDCGPCLQLGVTLAQRAGIADDLIARTIAHEATGNPDVDLVVGFCRSVLGRSDDEQALRERVVGRFGPDGLTAIAFTLNGTRLYPMLKAVLGYGMCYPSVQVGSKTVALHGTSSNGTPLNTADLNTADLNTADLQTVELHTTRHVRA